MARKSTFLGWSLMPPSRTSPINQTSGLSASKSPTFHSEKTLKKEPKIRSQSSFSRQVRIICLLVNAWENFCESTEPLWPNSVAKNKWPPMCTSTLAGPFSHFLWEFRKGKKRQLLPTNSTQNCSMAKNVVWQQTRSRLFAIWELGPEKDLRSVWWWQTSTFSSWTIFQLCARPSPKLQTSTTPSTCKSKLCNSCNWTTTGQRCASLTVETRFGRAKFSTARSCGWKRDAMCVFGEPQLRTIMEKLVTNATLAWISTVIYWCCHIRANWSKICSLTRRRPVRNSRSSNWPR